MKNKKILSKIKEIISNGKTLEACNNIDLILKKESDKYDLYVVLKNQLKRVLDESLLGVISNDQRNAKLNQLNYNLVKFVSTIKNRDCYEIVSGDKTQSEILEEIIKRNDENHFTINQIKAIHEQQLLDKSQIIKSLMERHRKETQSLRMKLQKQEERNEKLLDEKNEQAELIEKLNEKIEDLNFEIKRLTKIIKKEYSFKKIWNENDR